MNIIKNLLSELDNVLDSAKDTNRCIFVYSDIRKIVNKYKAIINGNSK